MKTIQMEIDEALLEKIERVTRAIGTTPSEFICNALENVLRQPEKFSITAGEWNDQKTPQKSLRALHDPEGIWAEPSLYITAQDIAEARREMWGKFNDKGNS